MAERRPKKEMSDEERVAALQKLERDDSRTYEIVIMMQNMMAAYEQAKQCGQLDPNMPVFNFRNTEDVIIFMEKMKEYNRKIAETKSPEDIGLVLAQMKLNKLYNRIKADDISQETKRQLSYEAAKLSADIDELKTLINESERISNIIADPNDPNRHLVTASKFDNLRIYNEKYMKKLGEIDVTIEREEYRRQKSATS